MGDGGAGGADLKSTSCNDLRRQVQTYLADFTNQKCTLSSECTNTSTACGLQGVCGVALNNASLPGLAALMMQWSSLGCADGSFATGKVGRDVDVKEAYEHAKLVGLGLLAAAKAAALELSRVEVLKVLGMVNAVPGFTDQPKVIDGCSDLFVAVLGERGRHARSAVGMGSLPFQITVEIEAVMHIHD